MTIFVPGEAEAPVGDSGGSYGNSQDILQNARLCFCGHKAPPGFLEDHFRSLTKQMRQEIVNCLREEFTLLRYELCCNHDSRLNDRFIRRQKVFPTVSTVSTKGTAWRDESKDGKPIAGEAASIGGPPSHLKSPIVGLSDDEMGAAPSPSVQSDIDCDVCESEDSLDTVERIEQAGRKSVMMSAENRLHVEDEEEAGVVVSIKTKMAGCSSWVSDLKEAHLSKLKEKKSAAQKLIESDSFDQAMGATIIFNAVAMGVQVNWQAGNLGKASPAFYSYLDTVFCVVFGIELGLRLWVHRCMFYILPGWQWSIFDSIIVGMQVMEEILKCVNAFILTDADAGLDMNVGVLKLLKIGRLLRMVRMVRLIPELKSMVYLILASMSSFFWTCVLLSLMVYMVAIYMTMMATETLEDPAQLDDELRADVIAYWGSIGDSIMSLFHSISGGQDWADLISPLVDATGSQAHNVIFSMFIAFSTMVIMNLVTGVFVEGAQRLSAEDRDKELFKMATKVFGDVDDDGSKGITWKEMQENMQTNVLLQEYLATMDLNNNNAKDLFLILDDDKSGIISIDEFVTGCMRLKGPARSADVCKMLVQTQRIADSVTKVRKRVSRTAKIAEKLLRQSAIVSKKVFTQSALAPAPNGQAAAGQQSIPDGLRLAALPPHWSEPQSYLGSPTGRGVPPNGSPPKWPSGDQHGADFPPIDSLMGFPGPHGYPATIRSVPRSQRMWQQPAHTRLPQFEELLV
eukprot:TRINITY_DN64803_c0_g1_i1.p1 TRINITY_DN64803_c0_g1~~TRINITY_DN64803_c0_g1_i1.p1  ORF type:complete len:740 (+),score=155.37 TRINITY_DN64803_c0_g1_i1:92-2311(+)